MTTKKPDVMNIHMNMLINAYQRLLADVQDLSGLSLDTPDEITYDWVLIEGPLLEKQCLAYIEGNRVEHPELPGWLTPLWDTFILTKDGSYLRWLRQLLLFCYKAEYEPTDEQLKKAQADFEDTDSSCAIWNEFAKTHHGQHLFRSARQYIGRVIGRIDWRSIVPSHGPGSVFPPCKPDEKSRFLTYYPCIQEYYPYDQNFWSLPEYWTEIMVHESRGRISEATRITAKLVAVPKDSRGPRLICVHPKESIWIQQGQRRLLERAIESSPLTEGKINFTDQTVNGSLAMSSSVTRELCSLDMKEASDRISCELVRSLFGDHAYKYLSCSRASHIKLIDGRVIELQKWAPMGNCLTFPVQSLIFWAVVRAGIRSRYGANCADVYVFGDDILFPSKYYAGVVGALTMIGCVPNIGKTFYKGFFRESCGVDAYHGIDVTPLRMKVREIITAQDAISTCDLAKRLRIKGMWRCSAYLYACVSERFGRLHICNNPMAQGLYEYVDCDMRTLFLYEPELRFSSRFHKWRVPCRQVRSVLMDVPNDDWYHLLDSLLRITRSDGVSDRGTEYPVPYRTRLSYGWADCH